jgi:hypothetical protein
VTVAAETVSNQPGREWAPFKVESLTVRRDKPWFGPMRSIGKAAVPLCWEGYAVTVAFLLGFLSMRLVDDPNRRAIATALLVAAYGVIVFLTWEDPDAEVRRGWRERFWSRQTLVWLGVWLAIAAACVFAAYAASLWGYHRPSLLR